LGILLLVVLKLERLKGFLYLHFSRFLGVSGEHGLPCTWKERKKVTFRLPSVYAKTTKNFKE